MRRSGKLIWALAIVTAVLIASRVALPYAVKDFVNRKLMALESYDGQVADVDLALWRGAYRVDGLRIVKTGSRQPVPFFDADSIDFSLEWKSLLRGRIVTECEMWRPNLNLVRAESEAASQLGTEVNWADELEKLVPFRFNTIRVHDGSATFRAPGIATKLR